jgi:hypothetical protein
MIPRFAAEPAHEPAVAEGAVAVIARTAFSSQPSIGEAQRLNKWLCLQNTHGPISNVIA